MATLFPFFPVIFLCSCSLVYDPHPKSADGHEDFIEDTEFPGDLLDQQDFTEDRVPDQPIDGETGDFPESDPDIIPDGDAVDGDPDIEPPPEFCLVVGGSAVDYGLAIIETPDNGLLAAGTTLSYGAGAGDFFLAKYGPDLSFQWANAYGSVEEENVRSVVNTGDGGHIVAGYGLLVKVDSYGEFQWAKGIGGADEGFIAPATDGGFVYGGDSFVFAKVGSDGIMVWKKQATNLGVIRSFKATAEGGYIASGFLMTAEHGNDLSIIKLSADGYQQWSKIIGGDLGDIHPQAVQVLDNGFFLIGTSNSYSAGDNDIIIIKLSPVGVLQWAKTIGGSGAEILYGASATPDGGCILTGITTSFGAVEDDLFVAKIDHEGEPQWSRVIGGPGDDTGREVIRLSNSNYAVIGYSTSYGTGSEDMLIALFGSDGSSCMGADVAAEVMEVTPRVEDQSVTINDLSVDSGGPDITTNDITPDVNSCCF